MTNTKSIPILDYEAELNGSLLCKKHPLFRILICIIACLILVSGFLLLFMESYFSAVLMLIMGPILAIAAYLEDKYEYIELKGSEVIARKGFINSKSLSIPVSKIQSVSIENDLFDKIIGCRTIKIDNAGTGYTEIVMKGMQNAEQFVSAVRKAMRNSGK